MICHYNLLAVNYTNVLQSVDTANDVKLYYMKKELTDNYSKK